MKKIIDRIGKERKRKITYASLETRLKNAEAAVVGSISNLNPPPP